jgi:formylglycine-generating enzyme required for sulfatase activity
MNKYAILIGNGSFPDEPKLSNLRCPLLDVLGLEKVLKNEARGDFNEVLVLKDQRHYEVERGLNKMLNQAQKQDLVLVYYSGHGNQSTRGQLFLTSLDTEMAILNSTAVGLDKVYDFINHSKCQKIILILDCCYSGCAQKSFKGNITSELQQMNAQSRGTYLITASTETETAAENQDDDYSLFTKHLIAGLETGAADKNANGHITIDEWYQYVHDKVLDEDKTQQPTKASKGERGELVIAKSGRGVRHTNLNAKIYPKLVELSRQHRQFASILAEWVNLEDISNEDYSSIQKNKYNLLIDLVNEKLDTIGFIDAWRESNQIQTKPLIINKDFTQTKLYKEIQRKDELEKQQEIIAVERQRKEEALVGKMVFIKGGTFLMGSPEHEKERGNDERQHQVQVDDFYMAEYQITQKLWQTIMGNNPARFKGEQFPVERVSWYDAQDFIKKLNTKTGENYRLPTEAEWEYAARAGTSEPFHTGHCINTEQANYDGNYDYNNCGAKTGVYKKTTVAVGSYPPNQFGLYDMLGNVWEWTGSVYDENYGRSEIGSNNHANNDSLVIRGGSWFDDPWWLRSANRGALSATSRFHLGFRISRTR